MNSRKLPTIIALVIQVYVWSFSLGRCDILLKQKNEFVEVITTTGEIKGKVEEVVEHEVLSFLGIPFAEPPIANNRFKKPIPIKPWENVLDATTKSPSCIQMINKDFGWIDKGKQNEDCLYLNIWVPKKFCTSAYLNATKYQLPVMVWIHGGGFWSGSSNLEITDGAALSAFTNVVVASMNYRIGSLGFLYSGTSDAPGNMGLHDQLLALKWIKDNAKSFCGDPNKITLFGESAGAMSVGLHLISPKSRNLFKRAIMESGAPYNPIFKLDHNLVKMKGSQFAAALGCADEKTNLVTDPTKVVSCLRNIETKDIFKVESLILENQPFSFVPIYGDDFLPKSPVEAINDKDIKQTEILIGNNRDEGAIFLNYAMPDVFTSKNAPPLPVVQAKSIIEALFQPIMEPLAKGIADFYVSNLTDENPKEIVKAIHDSFGDFVFVCPSVFFAKQMSTENKVFYYLFTHKPSNTPWGDWIRVGHYEEVQFVFGVPVKSKMYTSEECNFSYEIMQLWTNFARHGRPLPENEWPTFAHNEEFRELNPQSNVIGEKLHGKACDFWRHYF